MVGTIDKYISEGQIQRFGVALDVADGSISVSEIKSLCSDPRMAEAFIGTSYTKKQPKETWDAEYLNQIACAAVAEVFNQDYLLYLAEVAEYVRNQKTKNDKRIMTGVIATLAIVVVVIGFIVWILTKTGQ